MKFHNQPDHLRRPTQQTGFTLFELLVVIAIVALLLGILLPALNKARFAAQSAVCMSSLRQYAMAETIYAHDNKSQLRKHHSPPDRYTYDYVHPYELNNLAIANARSNGLPLDDISCPLVNTEETLQSLPLDEQEAWLNRSSQGATLTSYSTLSGIPLDFDSSTPKYIINQDPERDINKSKDSPFPTKLHSGDKAVWPIFAQDISDIEWSYSENRYVPRTFATHLRKTNTINTASLDGSVNTTPVPPTELKPSFSIRINQPNGGGYHHFAAK